MKKNTTKQTKFTGKDLELLGEDITMYTYEPLSIMEAKFVHYMPLASDPTEAARLAGYAQPGVAACRLKNRERIKKELAAREYFTTQAEQSSALNVKVELMKMYYLENSKPQPNPTTLLRIIDTINKMNGSYSETLNHQVNVEQPLFNITEDTETNNELNEAEDN